MEEIEKRYVVGVDGSPESREALRWAFRLAGVLGGEVVAVHALGLIERLHETVKRDWWASLRDTTTPFRIVVREGSPVDVLADVARRERASILVLGCRGLGSAPALALGSTSLHLLQTAPVPVLVVPHGEGGRTHLSLRRLVFAVDGVTRSDAALEVVTEIAAGFGSRVDLAHVIEDMPVFPLGPATRVSVLGETDAQERARSMLEPMQMALEDRGIPTHVRVERGRSAEALRSIAAQIDADLLVLTTSHIGKRSGALLGDSVSRSLASVLHRAVLVVPEGWASSSSVASQQLVASAR